MNTEQAPSATVSEEDNARLKQAIPLGELQPPTPIPSATVDEKHRIQCALKAIDDYRGRHPKFDFPIVGEIRIILTNATAEELKHYAPSHSQQTTVEVEKIADKLVAEWQNWFSGKTGGHVARTTFRSEIISAIQQALHGRYTRSEVITILKNNCHPFYKNLDDSAWEKVITKYDTERGK